MDVAVYELLKDNVASGTYVGETADMEIRGMDHRAGRRVKGCWAMMFIMWFLITRFRIESFVAERILPESIIDFLEWRDTATDSEQARV